MEEQQRIGFCRLLTLTLCAALLAACDQRVAIVNYTQVGACDSGRPHRAWVFFQIGQINNTRTDIDFNFKPLGVVLEQGMDPAVPFPGYAAIMTDWFVHSKAIPGRVTVSKGTAKVVDKYMVFDRWTSDPESWKEANQTAYLFTYNSLRDDPPVFMAKTNATQTSWPPTRDCNQIMLPDQNCVKCHRIQPLRSPAAVQQIPRAANVRK